MTLFGWELSRIIKWLLILALIWFIIQNPTGAAAEFHRFTNFLQHVMNSIITFFNQAAG